MTRIHSRNVSIGLLTRSGAADAGYPAVVSAPPSADSNALPASAAPACVASYDGITVDPTRIDASPGEGVRGPAVTFTCSLEYGTPRRTSVALATSHGDVNFDVPTGLNCTEQ